jgi:site-specific DNA-cytosine methylase
VGSDLTHASFFSGVGGLDLGLERAGWRTVSFSEIDPYASAVLAQRWPGVPNLGSIVDLAAGVRPLQRSDDGIGSDPAIGVRGRLQPRHDDDDWHRATLWTGGFPCQDLSIAGKRRGMGEGTRSGLAYAFLDLAAVHRPRFVLLENVPGLLSSHGGRDMAALLGALVELGYGVGYRVLDARWFGVPQRRRRVFILGVSPGGRAGAECAAEVLSVGSRCDRHPPTGVEAGPGTSPSLTRSTGNTGGHSGIDDSILAVLDATIRGHGSAADGATSTRTLGASMGHHGYTLGAQDVDGGYLQVSRPPDDARGQAGWRQGSAALRGHEPDPRDGADPDAVRKDERSSPDPDRMRATDGLAGRVDDRGGVAHSLEASDGHHGYSSPRGDGADNLVPIYDTDGSVAFMHDPMLPLGLDSHRYRCCGNGVVSDVAEWIGRRLADIA